MRGGVLVGAGITAAHPATFQTQPQVGPHLLTQCRAVLALPRGPWLWVVPGGGGKLRTGTLAPRRLGSGGSAPKQPLHICPLNVPT